MSHLSAHDGHADEDCGGDDGDLGEEEDERPHRVDGRHAHHVRRQHLEGATRARAEVVAVYRCVVLKYCMRYIILCGRWWELVSTEYMLLTYLDVSILV